MGVTSSVSLETTKTVEKSVADQTVDGYESVYSCYFNEATQEPEATSASTRDSLDDPMDCTD